MNEQGRKCIVSHNNTFVCVRIGTDDTREFAWRMFFTTANDNSKGNEDNNIKPSIPVNYHTLKSFYDVMAEDKDQRLYFILAVIYATTDIQSLIASNQNSNNNADNNNNNNANNN